MKLRYRIPIIIIIGCEAFLWFFILDPKKVTAQEPTITQTWEPLFTTPTPKPTEDYGCNGQLPIGWGTVTPETWWMINCSQCLLTATPQEPTPTGVNDPTQTATPSVVPEAIKMTVMEDPNYPYLTPRTFYLPTYAKDEFYATDGHKPWWWFEEICTGGYNCNDYQKGGLFYRAHVEISWSVPGDPVGDVYSWFYIESGSGHVIGGSSTLCGSSNDGECIYDLEGYFPAEVLWYGGDFRLRATIGGTLRYIDNPTKFGMKVEVSYYELPQPEPTPTPGSGYCSSLGDGQGEDDQPGLPTFRKGTATCVGLGAINVYYHFSLIVFMTGLLSAILIKTIIEFIK